MPYIPALDSRSEREAFAAIIDVPYVEAEYLNEEERAALREVYNRARKRLGVDANLRRLGYPVGYQESGGRKKLAAATVLTLLGYWMWKGRK